MNTPQEIRDIADQKYDDANVLFDHNRFDNAVYLAGYQVELYLKAHVLEFEGKTYQKIHKYAELLQDCPKLRTKINASAVKLDREYVHSNADPKMNWDVVTRYQKIGAYNDVLTGEFLTSVKNPVVFQSNDLL